jgi:hypothetical protein
VIMPAGTQVALTNPINIATGAAPDAPDPAQSNEYYPTLPAGIPVFGEETNENNSFFPATAEPVGSTIDAWNPWTHAMVAQMFDHSQPVAGADNNGEPAGLGLAGAFIGTWGGMPYPVLDYNDEQPAVLIVQRQGPYPANGPAGQYTGQQQAVQSLQQSENPPSIDYWSTLLGIS